MRRAEGRARWRQTYKLFNFLPSRNETRARAGGACQPHALWVMTEFRVETQTRDGKWYGLGTFAYTETRRSFPVATLEASRTTGRSLGWPLDGAAAKSVNVNSRPCRIRARSGSSGHQEAIQRRALQTHQAAQLHCCTAAEKGGGGARNKPNRRVTVVARRKARRLNVGQRAAAAAAPFPRQVPQRPAAARQYTPQRTERPARGF